jgi:NitT/TauT family transport system ATP-binding protein
VTTDHAITLDAVEKRFDTDSGAVQALAPTDLAIGARELIVLLGPSGCGKTTLLRLVAGLIAPSAGMVRVNGVPLWRGATRNADAVRDLGVVFQDANLFPWYSIEQNIALPLALRGIPRRERLRRARDLASLVGIAGFEKRWPRELSGGMRQRAAIARALTLRPSYLFMDEPFGALDEMTRDRLNFELLRILKETGATLLLVTHSIGEAVVLSDTVVVMSPRPGRITRRIEVDFGHQRTPAIRDDPRFARLESEVRHALNDSTTD